MSKNAMASKSIYIHYPHCRHLCNYCDFYKTKIDGLNNDHTSFHHYLQMSREPFFKLHPNFKDTEISTLYIGGGTPSLWHTDGAKFIQDFFKENNLNFSKDYEFTLEVNPGSWNEEGLAAWKEAGVNRFSLGVQTLNEKAIKTLDRIHSIDDVYSTLDHFKTLEENFSIDFMLGIPFSDEFDRDIEDELAKILKWSPPHISLYIFKVARTYIHYKNLPDEDFIRDEYLLMSEILRSNGFLHYEVSNFAKKDKESKHNLAYWNAQTVAALGPSATGFINQGDTALRYKWSVNDPRTLNESLDAKQLLLEKLYLGLRTMYGVDLLEYGVDIKSDLFQALKQRWIAGDLLTKCAGSRLKLSEKGYLMLDSVIGDLFHICKLL